MPQANVRVLGSAETPACRKGEREREKVDSERCSDAVLCDYTDTDPTCFGAHPAKYAWIAGSGYRPCRMGTILIADIGALFPFEVLARFPKF